MTATMSDLAVAVARLQEARQSIIAFNDPTALSKLLDAHDALIAAQQERATLLERIRELESLAATKARYQLVSLGAQNVVAFAPTELRPSEPPHYLCPNCFAADKINYFLQTSHGPYSLGWHCNACDLKASVDTGRARQISANPNRGGWV